MFMLLEFLSESCNHILVRETLSSDLWNIRSSTLVRKALYYLVLCSSAYLGFLLRIGTKQAQLLSIHRYNNNAVRDCIEVLVRAVI